MAIAANGALEKSDLRPSVDGIVSELPMICSPMKGTNVILTFPRTTNVDREIEEEEGKRGYGSFGKEDDESV